MKVGTAWPAFFCIQDGNLKGVCHGDDFCLVARVKQAELTRFSAGGVEELQILSRTIQD